MNLLQESETLEGFARQISEGPSRTNNFALNGDNLVDSI
jgi:hypothetical protein